MAFGFSSSSGNRAADVSVVIPVYNHERYVGAAIGSALQQTVAPREIVCIDDGSKDGSFAVVQALAARHPSIRCWTRPNQGAHHTLNEAIAAAQGRYVAILNSDDLHHPGRLARCLAVLDADPSVAVVSTGIAFIDADGRARRNEWYEKACAFHARNGDLGLSLVNGNFLMTTSNVVARRTVFEETGPFDDLRYTHDLDFFLRLIAAGKKLSVVPRALMSYRLHGSNTISESQVEVKTEWAAVAACFARRLAESGRGSAAYLARLMAVAQQHGLTPLMALALLQPNSTTPGACLSDPELRAAMRELAT